MTLPVATGDLPYVDDWNSMVPDGTGEWRSYLPRIFDSGTFDYLKLGSGSVAVGRYFRIGKFAFSIVRIRFGTTGATFGTGLWNVVPFPGDINTGDDIASPLYTNFLRLGTGLAVDVSANVGHVLVPYPADNNFVRAQSPSPSGGALANLSGTAPFTWAASDELHLHYMYERV